MAETLYTFLADRRLLLDVFCDVKKRGRLAGQFYLNRLVWSGSEFSLSKSLGLDIFFLRSPYHFAPAVVQPRIGAAGGLRERVVLGSVSVFEVS